MISPAPNQVAMQNANGVIDPAWKAFFTDVFNGIAAMQLSGTTAQRPTKNLYIGRLYFDTSLGVRGKPIWIAKDGVTWVLADGTVA